MIPPSALQCALWRSALYIELTLGFWRALAAPWLQPGRPVPASAPDRQRAREPAGERTVFAPDAGAQPPAEATEHRVIEVPRSRWQHRRAPARSARTEG